MCATDVLYRGRWIATAMLVLCLGQILAWAFDRTPPFHLLGSTVERPVYPGGPLRVTLNVQRDLGRNCDLIVTRYVVDGRGFRFYLPEIQLNHAAIKTIERGSPGENRILLQMPDDATPGGGAMGNVLSYECNLVHKLWPIRIGYEVPFQIEQR